MPLHGSSSFLLLLLLLLLLLVRSLAAITCTVVERRGDFLGGILWLFSGIRSKKKEVAQRRIREEDPPDATRTKSVPGKAGSQFRSYHFLGKRRPSAQHLSRIPAKGRKILDTDRVCWGVRPPKKGRLTKAKNGMFWTHAESHLVIPSPFFACLHAPPTQLAGKKIHP